MEYTQIRDVFLNNLTENERKKIIILTNYLLQIDNAENNNKFLSHIYPSSEFNLSQYDPKNRDTIIRFANYTSQEYKRLERFDLIIHAINSTERINSSLLKQYPKVKIFLDVVVLMNCMRQKLRGIIQNQNYLEFQGHLDTYLIKHKEDNMDELKPFSTWQNVLNNWLNYSHLYSAIFNLINGGDINQSYELNRLEHLIDGYENYDNITTLTLRISREQLDNIYNTFFGF